MTTRCCGWRRSPTRSWCTIATSSRSATTRSRGSCAGRPWSCGADEATFPGRCAVSPAFAAPVLACGALLKNTFCIGVGDSAHVGPHIGDLSNLAAYDAYVAAIERLRAVPARRARDHRARSASRLPVDALCAGAAGAAEDWRSAPSRAHRQRDGGARSRRARSSEWRTTAPATAPTATAWGGEILRASSRSASIAWPRCGRFVWPAVTPRSASRGEWRWPSSDDAFDGDVPASVRSRFAAVRASQIDGVLQLLKHGEHAPLAHGAGRYFDGVAALVLGRPGRGSKASSRWRGTASPIPTTPAGIRLRSIRASAPWTIDLRPMIRSIVADLEAGVAGRPHLRTVPQHAVRGDGAWPLKQRRSVRIAAGRAHRRLLSESAAGRRADRAAGAALRRVLQSPVPPGDGGIALGQAVVAVGDRERNVTPCASECQERSCRLTASVATVDFWGVQRQVRLDVVDEPVQPGDYILNHVGFAIRRIPAERDRRHAGALRRAAAARRGRRGSDGGRRARGDRGDRPMIASGANELQFRDPERARGLAAALDADRRRHRPRRRVGDARVRQPRAGDRQVRAARDVAEAAERDHGPGLPGLHHRRARGRRGRGAGAAGRPALPPTATWSRCRAR